MSENTIIEINGVKLDVDLRTAQTVEEYRVGDPVKVLKKGYGGYTSYHGVLVGFDAFKKLPTLIIAYLGGDTDPISFAYYNQESTDVEICKANPNDLQIEKADIIDRINRSVSTKENEILDLRRKEKYFLEMFGKYFENEVQ